MTKNRPDEDAMICPPRVQLDFFGTALPVEESLVDARKTLEEKRVSGSVCPCCEQWAQSYRRKLNSNIAVFVVSLVREWERMGSEQMVSYRRCTFIGRDYGYAKHWGLATDEPADTPSKRRTGQWRPSPRGVLFAKCQLLVPSYLYVYNNRVVEFGDDLVDVKHCLGTRFDYAELIGRR